jgi:glyoxylase-like metal-dependent hydrolase (beta-lactamase superfamily II)
MVRWKGRGMTTTIDVGNARFTVMNIAQTVQPLDNLATNFPTVGREQLAEAIQADPPDWSFNLSLVEIDGTVVLVDTGFLFAGRSEARSTSELLAEAGYAASDVDVVVITHCHGDHIGGLVSDGSRAFANARLIIDSREHEFWTGDESEKSGRGEAARGVRGALAPYKDVTRLVRSGDVVAEFESTTLTTVDAPGHTPGHMGLRLESAGSTLMVLADTLHAVFQMRHPDWSPRFDVDPLTAEATRRSLLRELADSAVPAHFYHLAFPGLGRVVADRDAYAWSPISE